ncbi:MFS transporter [Rickettsia endosymbiont of Culicoides newsteadi]|uniref:MFS transporter n=1 Tax=Rickettsia endosymbiont of Culicoides newsteadi TaxID=1961830 RepID=UPI000B9A8924|nr:MFS transporter [Rickettsia endosymbiont of Culicoides newsteadi]
MRYQQERNLTKDQKEAIGLFSVGTFLEYFDLMLYVHMGEFFNELFFKPTDSHTASLMKAVIFCSTFIFRPIGALIFGWIGDNIGRKSTVIITTSLMAVSCFVMANLPTYAQIGSMAAWIATIRRIVQGVSAIVEVTGAQLYLTETINPPAQYASIGLIWAFCSLGSLSALGVASLVSSYDFNWRLAFWAGTVIALVGFVARTKLREAPEFVDAQYRIKRVFERINIDTAILKANPIWQAKVNKKTLLAFFLLQCVAPVCFYFIYIHCANILKTSFDYTMLDVIHHNFIICIIELLVILVLSYLSLKMYPLLILRIILIISAIFIVFCPYLLNHVNSPYQLFLIQSVLSLLHECLGPALPICYKSFPIFKRFICASMTFALSRAFMYVITSFGLVYLVEYFGNWGLLFIMIPAIIGFAYGLLHFEKLAKDSGNYSELT